MDRGAPVQELPQSRVEVERDRIGSPDSVTPARGFHSASVWLTVAAGFLIPISTSLTELCLALLPVCWLLSGEYRSKYEMIRQNRVVLLCLALFGMYAASLTYTTAPVEEAVAGLLKYRPLLYVPIFLTIFADPRARDWGIRGFEAAMLLTLAVSCVMVWAGIESKWGEDQPGAVFKNHITQNILMAFAAYLLGHRFVEDRERRWLYAVLILLALWNILFMVEGRTGYVVLAALVVLFLFQQRGVRGLAYAALLVVIGGATAYALSGSLHMRVNQAARQFVEYEDVRRDAEKIEDSSIGLRLSFYETGLQIARQNPLLGTGIGSLEYEYQQAAEHDGGPATSNPHSEYLAALMQAGPAGLGLLLCLFSIQWRHSRRLPLRLQFMAQGLVVTMAVGCLINSLLLDTTEGNFYGYFTALCSAGLFSRETNYSRWILPRQASSPR